MAKKENKVYGILAEFDNPAELLHAAEKVRDAGYKRFDCHSPFPIHGMDEAMGLKRSPLGWMVGFMGMTGAGLGTLMQWWMNAVDYKLVISGKPFFSYPAYVPVTFGVGVLFAALTAVFGMFHLNRLPMLHHPVYYSDNFGKVTDDGFMISVEATDPKFDAQATKSFFESIGAKSVELLQPE
ncbi:MAG TPA: DUF3341 domain-containing protein [Bacteroidetes bacterium]|nr:DUF3341 domain-containing protein [Bacteroidota bacterium]